MGSFMAQQFISEHGRGLAGAVLSGSGGRPLRLTAAVRLLARMERLRLGERGRSALINSLTFGAFNKPFEPAPYATFDWLSRDHAEGSTEPIADPLCGVPSSLQLSIDVLDALDDVTRVCRQSRIPKPLPIHIRAMSRPLLK